MSILILTNSRGNVVIAGLGLGQEVAPADRLPAHAQKSGNVRLKQGDNL